MTFDLSDAARKRLDRIKSRRGRNRPSKVPARLVRTSAFAPKRRGLVTDSAFERLYVVPGHSVVRVKGRELGSQHRDALYAVFRLPHEIFVIKDERAPLGMMTLMVVSTTWRELLRAMGLTEHVNNVAALHFAFEDVKNVTVTVYEGQETRLALEFKEGKLPRAGGKMGNLLHDVEWSGLGLDDNVRISFGDWTATMIRSAKLVSLNADVQFGLVSEYAKSFWPYIDSFSSHTWIDETTLATLVGRDLWAPDETSRTRTQFRFYCRKAFKDMVRAGGLRSWRVEVRGSGRHKIHRYHYVHGLDAEQLELPIGSLADNHPLGNV